MGRVEISSSDSRGEAEVICADDFLVLLDNESSDTILTLSVTELDSEVSSGDVLAMISKRVLE
jgi:hypothetical protein